mmetsp:Transcript_36295/g.58657  ORF Transcript_36295/g.58657 Transcript_36295/m.58657 type:complete len:216 (+) Transcript_36295:725-1372(+)
MYWTAPPPPPPPQSRPKGSLGSLGLGSIRFHRTQPLFGGSLGAYSRGVGVPIQEESPLLALPMVFGPEQGRREMPQRRHQFQRSRISRPSVQTELQEPGRSALRPNRGQIGTRVHEKSSPCGARCRLLAVGAQQTALPVHRVKQQETLQPAWVQRQKQDDHVPGPGQPKQQSLRPVPFLALPPAGWQGRHQLVYSRTGPALSPLPLPLPVPNNPL